MINLSKCDTVVIGYYEMCKDSPLNRIFVNCGNMTTVCDFMIKHDNFDKLASRLYIRAQYLNNLGCEIHRTFPLLISLFR